MVVGTIGAMGGIVASRWVAVGATFGSCGESVVVPVDAATASAFLFLLRPRLFLLLPFFCSPSFGVTSSPISSCCCLTDSASGALRRKVLVPIILSWCSGMDEERRTGVKMLCDDVEIQRKKVESDVTYRVRREEMTLGDREREKIEKKRN